MGNFRIREPFANMDKRVDNQKKWNQAKHDDCAQEPFLLITVAEERNQG